MSDANSESSAVEYLNDCAPTEELLEQAFPSHDRLLFEVYLREYLSTSSIITYGEGKYTPLHIFIEVFNHFTTERNFSKVPIFTRSLDLHLRQITSGRVHINFEVDEEEWPIGSEIVGRSVYVRNVCVNAVANTDGMEDSEPESDDSDVSTTSSNVSHNSNENINANNSGSGSSGSGSSGSGSSGTGSEDSGSYTTESEEDG